MIFISFYAYLSLPVSVHNNTATYPTVAAGTAVTARRKFIVLMINCHCYSAKATCPEVAGLVSAAGFLINRVSSTITETAITM